MSDFDWQIILRDWNDRLMTSAAAEDLPQNVRDGGWLGFPPATDEQISSAERRLGIPLPPSYRAFLQVSDGWRQLTHAIDRLWGIEEINWFKRSHKDWIAAYMRPSSYGPRDETADEEYFSYQTPLDFRPGHLKETLQISEVGDAAVLLLNPQVVDKNGEWEAWFFANWVPGVERYRSFQEFMESAYHSLLNREWRQPVGLLDGLPDEFIGSPGSAKRRRRTRRRRQARKVFGKPLDQWDVAEMVGFLSHEDSHVRGEAAWALGELKEHSAIEPLFSLLTDDSNVSITAMHALKTLAPERLRKPLLGALEKRHAIDWSAAAHILAEMNEIRAIPFLVRMIEDTSPEEFHRAEIAAQPLAAFGSAGFDALVELLNGGDSTARRRATQGLYYSKDPRTIGVFQRLVSDDDPQVRQLAEISLKVSYAPRQRR